MLSLFLVQTFSLPFVWSLLTGPLLRAEHVPTYLKCMRSSIISILTEHPPPTDVYQHRQEAN